jgi:hypothetical protein
MAGLLPESEDQLYRSRPGANQEGVFPRTALVGGEKVLYETRPSISGLSPFLFWGGGAILGFLLLILLTAALERTVAGVIAVGFFTLLVGIPFFYAVYAWRTTAYALTDQRVLTRAGGAYASAPMLQIRGLSLTTGSSKLIFEMAAPEDGTRRSGFAWSRTPQVVWKATPMASAVLPFAQSAVAFYGIRDRQQQLRQSLEIASKANRIVCAYCGASIDPTVVNPADPKCPNCAAPLTVSGVARGS